MKRPQFIGVVFWILVAIGLGLLAASRTHTIICALLSAGCLTLSAMLVNDIRRNRY